ncbi:hypothetical protein B0H16DRAFT_1446656 [Mycena metata]|uniref:Uncharacterized protein n=1 Tax=Mycena metata TaxID=1033252 RepID=A0AAD7P1E0_9AGAR|nr:hypothetical protein B0H16DRAFT_1446656 [Mycena metata]
MSEPSSETILDQLAGIKILLREQAEERVQHAKYKEERRETADKQRAESAAVGEQVREKLKFKFTIRSHRKLALDRNHAQFVCWLFGFVLSVICVDTFRPQI